MKFRREDIEITWDVVQETEENLVTQAYPNPTNGIINIPIKNKENYASRIQIFDAKGIKCLDCAFEKVGNIITLDTKNLGTGLYIYKVISNKGLLAKGNFIKE